MKSHKKTITVDLYGMPGSGATKAEATADAARTLQAVHEGRNTQRGSTMNETLHIRPGYGYWDISCHPIGGHFRRVPSEGEALPVTNVTMVDTCNGANRRGKVAERTTIAFDYNATIEAEQERLRA